MRRTRPEDALIPFLGTLAQTQAQLYFGLMALAVSKAGRNRYADSVWTPRFRRFAAGLLALVLIVSTLAGTTAAVEVKLMGDVGALVDHSNIHARGFLISLPLHFASSFLFDLACSIVLVVCVGRAIGSS